MLKNGKIEIEDQHNWSSVVLCTSAYEVWGSPEILNKEKMKRTKARQKDYESKMNDRNGWKSLDERFI